MTMAGLLGLVTLQRLGELTLARRNTNRLRAQGGYAVSAGHYPLIVALERGWSGSGISSSTPDSTAWTGLGSEYS